MASSDAGDRYEQANRVDHSTGLNAPGAVFQAPVYLDWGPKDRAPTAEELLVLGSVQAPFGRLPQDLRGRSETCQLLTTGPSDEPARVQVLSGMGGVGKTAIALSLAADARSRGCEVLWINASSPATLADGLRQVALLAGAPGEQVVHAWREPGQAAAELLWRCLADWERQWFLVFDGADDLDILALPGSALSDATGWVRMPTENCCSILITTRDGNQASWGAQLANFTSIESLACTPAAEVLLDLAPGAGDISSARNLAKRLGGLPLALHLAGMYLAQAHDDPTAQARTFAEYLKILDDSPLVLDDALEGVRGDLRSEEDRARHTIAGTWELSLALLDQQGINQARPLLRLLACFSPAAPLPRSLTDPNGIAAASTWSEALTPRIVKLGLDGLRRFGLLDVNKQTGGPEFQLHRLVADVSVVPLIAAPSKRREIWAGASRLLVGATPQSGRDPASWAEWQGIIPHWQALLRRLPRCISGEAFAEVLHCAGFAASYLRSRGDYSAARLLAEETLDHAQSIDVDATVTFDIRYQRALVLRDAGDLKSAEEEFSSLAGESVKLRGVRKSATLAARYELAAIAHRRGKYDEAEKEFQAILLEENALFGQNSHLALITRHDRAVTLRALGMYMEAEKEFRDVLGALVDCLGENHPDTLATRHELAVVLRDRQRLDAAEREFRTVLAAEENVLGAEHPSTLTTRANIATILQIRGQLGAAEAEYRTVLDSRKRFLDPDHPETLDVRSSLAANLVAQEKLTDQDAEEEFRDLIRTQRRQLMADHQGVLSGRGNLATVLRAQGKLTEAESHYRVILMLRKRRHGERHPWTLNARYEWAMVLALLGRTEESESELRETLMLQREALGEDHANTLSVQVGLGNTLLQRGKLLEAERHLHAALSKRNDDPDAKRSEIRQIRHDLAAVFHARGKWSEAIDQLREILDEDKRVQGAAHRDTIVTLNTLAVALKSFGELDEAEALCRLGVEAAAHAYDGDQPLALALRHNLAILLRLRGELAEAETEHRDILQFQLASFGTEHPNTLASRHSLARVLEEKGAVAEAEAEYRAVRKIRSRVLGPQHPATLSTWGNLAFLIRSQGRLKEAEREYRASLRACEKALGVDHPDTLTANHNLAFTLEQRGKLGEAASRFRQVIIQRAVILGHDHPDTLTARENLAFVLCRQGRDEWEDELRGVTKSWERIHGSDHLSTLKSRYRRGQLLWEMGKRHEACTELREIWQRSRQVLPSGHPFREIVRRDLVSIMTIGRNI